MGSVCEVTNWGCAISSWLISRLQVWTCVFANQHFMHSPETPNSSSQTPCSFRTDAWSGDVDSFSQFNWSNTFCLYSYIVWAFQDVVGVWSSTVHVQRLQYLILVFCSSPCSTDPLAPGDLKEAFDVCTLQGSVRTRKLVVMIHTTSHSLPELLECMNIPFYRNIQMA